MKWIAAKVVFDADNKAVAEELISNLFYTIGLKGVVVEGPDVEPVEGWAKDAVDVPEHDAVIGYFLKDEDVKEKCGKLEDRLARLEKESGMSCRILFEEIEEEDWCESWKEFFRPEKIGNQIVVKPTWRNYEAQPEEIILDIDPGMAFGTGIHPTTSQCIRFIEKYLKQGDAFLDVGTGSGILMIAAAKLGAQKVWGIDVDDVAVDVALKNLRRNHIDTGRYKVMTGNLVEGVGERFHMVAANILSEVIVKLLDSVKTVLTDDGIFVCAGMIEEDRDPVIKKMEDLHFDILEIKTSQEWVTAAGRIKKTDNP